MIASFLALGLIFRTNTRVVQTYLEIVKTIIIVVFIRNMRCNSWWIFVSACILSCLIFVSVSDTLIYNVPAIIGGCVIGLQKSNSNKIINYIAYFIVNSIMIVYEFIMFGLFMKTNLFILYQKQLAIILSEFTSGVITELFLQVLFWMFVLFDSAFSSFVIFVLSQIVLKELKMMKSSSCV